MDQYFLSISGRERHSGLYQNRICTACNTFNVFLVFLPNFEMVAFKIRKSKTVVFVDYSAQLESPADVDDELFTPPPPPLIKLTLFLQFV